MTQEIKGSNTSFPFITSINFNKSPFLVPTANQLCQPDAGSSQETTLNVLPRRHRKQHSNPSGFFGALGCFWGSSCQYSMFVYFGVCRIKLPVFARCEIFHSKRAAAAAAAVVIRVISH